MFRRLLNTLLGDSLPKWLDLCDQCRTAYIAAGIFNPPLNYNQLVDILYNFALLCSKPCGVVLSKPPQPGIGFKALQLFLSSGINCHHCRIALLTMTHIVSVITALRPEFCTAIGNLDHSLNQDCATITIYLEGVSDGEPNEEDSPLNLKPKL